MSKERNRRRQRDPVALQSTATCGGEGGYWPRTITR